MTEPTVNQVFNAPVGGIQNGDCNQMNIHHSIGFSSFNAEITETRLQIQQIFKELTKNQPMANIKDIEDELKTEIRKNPALKNRILNAFKSGGIEALKAIFNHPFVSIPIETIRGWIDVD